MATLDRAFFVLVGAERGGEGTVLVRATEEVHAKDKTGTHWVMECVCKGVDASVHPQPPGQRVSRAGFS